MSDNYIKLSACLLDIASLENSSLESFLTKLSETFEKMRRIEGRVSNDQDLKLSDCLRYHMRDTNAAKDLLYRRLRYSLTLLYWTGLSDSRLQVPGELRKSEQGAGHGPGAEQGCGLLGEQVSL